MSVSGENTSKLSADAGALDHVLEVVALYRSVAHNFVGNHGKPPGTTPTDPVDSVECVAGRGIRGDRFFDYKQDYEGQITFFDWAVYDRLCRELDVRDKHSGVFRRNVITRGVDLNTLVGREFTIQGIRFLGTVECKPCYWMNYAFAPGAEQALRGHGGLRARILTSGTLRRARP